MLESKARKILVIKFRHIGDVLLTSPLITTLKQAHPENRISAAVKPGTEAMLEGHPDLDQLYILPQRAAHESKFQFFYRYLKWIWKIRKEQFDLSINTTEGDRGIILSYLTGAKTRLGILKENNEKWWRSWMINHHSPPIKGKNHTVIRNLSLASPLTARYNYKVTLNFLEEDIYTVRDLLSSKGWNNDRPLVHIHPTSRWLFKCWNDQLMAEVIDWLEATGHRVVLTAAPVKNELEHTKHILQHCNRLPIDLSGKFTLKQLAALSSLSKLFFGVDSAPMHIAASQGTPVIALFGPSGSFHWGPWPNEWNSSASPYQKRNGTQYADQHLVIQQNWECVPCGQDGCGGSKKSRCLDELTPATVISLLQQQILRS